MKKTTFLLILLTLITYSPGQAQEKADVSSSPYENFGACNIFSSEATQTLSLETAIETAMTNNIALSIEKLKPQLEQSNIDSEKSQFDTGVAAEVSGSEKIGKTIFQQGNLGNSVSNRTDAAFTLSELSQSGTRSELGLSVSRTRSANSNNLFTTRVGLNIEHPLMQGSGKAVNLVSLRKAELDRDISEFELQAYVMNLAAQVENRYWQYHLTLKELEIVKESLTLAQQQREETFKRIEAGSMPESESAAAEAEVALRQEGVINAESQAVLTAVSLLRSINPDSDNFWKQRPLISNEPLLQQPEQLDLDEHIITAMKNRPELEQARLLLAKDKLDLIYSENGVLPKLDFFINLGKSGYSKSLSGSNPKLTDNGSYDISAGFIYEITRGRRAARAELSKAKFSAAMSSEAIRNLEQLIKEDVIKAFIEVKRTLQQITATAATSQKQQEKLRVEEVKFNVGKTTAFQVAQAQRDLTAARIAEVKAAVDFCTAMTELHRADGSLLQRQGIVTATSR